MKHVLVVGLGSIGCRHVAALRELGIPRIDAYRTGRSTMRVLPHIDHHFNQLEDALKARPDGVFICNPTASHISVAERCVEYGIDIFVEKPICCTVREAQGLMHKAQEKNVRVVVGYNMRYHPIISKLKEIGVVHHKLGKLLTTRIYFGSYLPDWHPWEDYKSSYAARRDLGGGAGLTSIHELDYAIWLWGGLVESCSMESSMRTIGTDVDENSMFLLRHTSGVISSISLSLSERVRKRQISMTFESGRMEIDLLLGVWMEYNAEGEVRQLNYPIDFNKTYIMQDKHFIDGHDHSSSPLGSLHEAIDALRALES